MAIAQVKAHLEETQRLLREHCYLCRKRGVGCVVCHVAQAQVEIKCAQAAAPALEQ